MNKLALIIVNRDIEKSFTKKLVEDKFVFTRIGSTGGFLKKKNVTLLIGLEEDRVPRLIEVLKCCGNERETLIGSDSGVTLSDEAGAPGVPLGAAPLHVGGATLFILPVEKILKV